MVYDAGKVVYRKVDSASRRISAKPLGRAPFRKHHSVPLTSPAAPIEREGGNMKWIPRIAPFIVISILAGCPEPVQPAGDAILEVAARIVSVQVGEQATLPFTACKPDGSPDGISAVCSNGCAAVTVNPGVSIVVQGMEIGETTVTMSSDCALEKTVLIRVYDPKALMVSGLAVTYTNHFEWRWNDKGSGMSHDGEFFHPIAPAGYYPLGSVGNPAYISAENLGKQLAAIVVKQIGDSGALAAPTDYTKIWSATFDVSGSFWLPVAPEGYVALGVVVKTGTDAKPGLDEVRCVRSDLAADAKAGASAWWWNVPINYPQFASWQTDPPTDPNAPGKAFLKAGTIFAISGSTSAPPSDPALHILNLKLPLSTDLNDSTFAPVLDGYDEPPTTTDLYLSKVIDVPFPLVVDNAHDLSWKVANSPIYRIRREEYYNNQYFYNNRYGSTPITHTVTDTVGISETDSETYRVTVGIKISATSGCSLIGGGVTVELSFEFGYETTSSTTVFQERSVSQEVIIAPGTAGCLWEKATRFTLARNNGGWEDVQGSAREISIESFVKGEYPH